MSSDLNDLHRAYQTELLRAEKASEHVTAQGHRDAAAAIGRKIQEESAAQEQPITD